VSLDLTSSNILFELNNFDKWSKAEIYEQLGKPRTAPVLMQSGASAGPYAPAQVIESIQYSNIDEKWLTGGIRITDFGESFFINGPPPKSLGTPASYLAPEIAFGRPASVASDVWALVCLTFELQASRPLICLFFGRVDEALAETVHTLGPLPKAWRESYIDKTRITKFQPGQKDPLFDPIDMRHPLEHLVSIIKPQLSTEETANFLAFLRGALEYEPSARLSAKQLVMHPWLVS
jgi:serine/threonine protein kinase